MPPLHLLQRDAAMHVSSERLAAVPTVGERLLRLDRIFEQLRLHSVRSELPILQYFAALPVVVIFSIYLQHYSMFVTVTS